MKNFLGIVLIIILIGSSVCFAEDIFISQKNMGSDTGQDCFNAHSAAWFNESSHWGDGNGLIGPGDTVHLCNNISSSLIVQGSGTSLKPIVILFEENAKLTSEAWGVDSDAAIYASNKNYIIIDGGSNGKVECLNNGTALKYQQQSHGISIVNCNHWEIKNLTVKNIYFRIPHSSDPNRFGRCLRAKTCNFLNIHDCVFNNAEFGLYITTAYQDSSHLTVSNCDMYECATAIVVALSSPNDYTYVTIDNNKIHDLEKWDGEWNNGTSWHHCDGIHTWGNYPGNKLGPLTVSNNHFYGDFGKHVSGWIYISDFTDSVEIKNNLFENGGQKKPSHGFIFLSSHDELASAYVHDNKMVGLGSTNTGGTGINVRFMDVRIEKNWFQDLFTGIYVESGNVNINSDFNTFLNVGNIGHDYKVGFIETLSEWQNYLGGCPEKNRDCNSNTTTNQTTPTEPANLRKL